MNNLTLSANSFKCHEVNYAQFVTDISLDENCIMHEYPNTVSKLHDIAIQDGKHSTTLKDNIA
jgi:hypothetical protein